MDTISVIVAVYNAESSLEKCLESLLSQTYSAVEIILINDCSADRSMDICKKYSNEYDSILLINNEYNMGVSETRNKGINVSTGDYICFVDSDDWVEKDYLEKLILYYKEYNTVPICGFVFHDDYNKFKPIEYKWSKGNGIVSLGEAFNLYKELYLTALWNKIFDNREIKKHNIRFERDLSIGEDLRFTLDYFNEVKIDSVYAFCDTLYHYIKLNDNNLYALFCDNINIELGKVK